MLFYSFWTQYNLGGKSIFLKNAFLFPLPFGLAARFDKMEIGFFKASALGLAASLREIEESSLIQLRLKCCNMQGSFGPVTITIYSHPKPQTPVARNAKSQAVSIIIAVLLTSSNNHRAKIQSSQLFSTVSLTRFVYSFLLSLYKLEASTLAGELVLGSFKRLQRILVSRFPRKWRDMCCSTFEYSSRQPPHRRSGSSGSEECPSRVHQWRRHLGGTFG